MRLGVAVSGQGTNLRNLVERGLDVVAVATNRPGCGGAMFARTRGLALGEFPQSSFESALDRDSAMAAFFGDHRVDVVVDAGYDRIHTSPFLDAFAGRIVNLHPSLLPAFAGRLDAIEAALAAGVQVTGATVHIVTRDLDAGPVLVQEAVPVMPGDSVDTLRQRVHQAEYRILPRALELMEERLGFSPALG